MEKKLAYRKRQPPSDAELTIAFHKKYVYDPLTGAVAWLQSGHGRVAGSQAGGSDGKGYLSLMLAGHKFKLHRIAWLVHYGHSPEGLLDHVNGDRRDNRIANLRPATDAQNVRNRIRNGSLMPGVSKNKNGRYCARIQHGNSKLYLGYYDTPEEASAAYAGASIVLHGEYAATATYGAGALMGFPDHRGQFLTPAVTLTRVAEW